MKLFFSFSPNIKIMRMFYRAIFAYDRDLDPKAWDETAIFAQPRKYLEIFAKHHRISLETLDSSCSNTESPRNSVLQQLRTNKTIQYNHS